MKEIISLLSPPPPPPERNIWGIIWPVLLILFVAAIDGLFVNVGHPILASPESAGEFTGTLLGTAVIALLIALLIARIRQKKTSLAAFALIFAVAVPFSSIRQSAQFVEMAAAGGQSGRNEQEQLNQSIGNLLKESAGTKPASGDALPVLGPEVTAVFRGWFHDVFEMRQRHIDEVKQFAPVLSKLYSAESFSSPARMRQSMQALDTVVQSDEQYAAGLNRMLGALDDKIQATTLSDSQKTQVKRGFRRGFESSAVVALQPARQAENEWATRNHALYDYALQHAAQVQVHGTKIVIANSAVRNEFNRLMQESKAAGRAAMTAGQIAKQRQEEGLNQIGVTENDFSPKK